MKRKLVYLLIVLFIWVTPIVVSAATVAESSESVLYVPLIGITAVPDPFALPKGSGKVTYHYAVKNFLQEISLNNIKVVDNKCNSVVFIEGDDDSDSRLDYNETWRYSCTREILETTQSIATVTGTANNINTTDSAYATVIVGLNSSSPLVSIVNITKIAFPLALPPEGGKIVFTYRVNNPGVAPLSNVVVKDDKCSSMSGRLGDTNGNNLLDTSEVWIYTCTMKLTQTTTNTVTVTAFSNKLKASDSSTITVEVDSPNLPNVGKSHSLKIKIWIVFSGVLLILIFISFTSKRLKEGQPRRRYR